MKKTKPKVKITKIEDVGTEVMAQEIVLISKAMRTINNSRLTREAILILIKEQTKIPKATIQIVLNSLDQLERTYVKAKNK